MGDTARRAFRGKPKQLDRGLTLLELLLTLVVLSLLAASLAAALRGTDRARVRAVAAVELGQRAQTAFALLRADLYGAQINASAATDGFRGQAESGKTSLSFVTNSALLPSAQQRFDLSIVRWALEEEDQTDADGNTLYRLVRATAGNVYQTTEINYETQTVLRGLSAWTVFYTDGGDWTDTWDAASADALPAAIVIRLYRHVSEAERRIEEAQGRDPQLLALLGQAVIRIPIAPDAEQLF